MKCISPIQLKSGDIVPCGKCYCCLANQRSEWIFRLQQEFLVSSFSIFVTLTYDDDHIPADMSVSKRDLQLFHKRLRKHFPSGDLRFYAISEYGDRTFRPHYHGLYFFKSNYDNDFIYKTFEDSWKNGFIKFGQVEEGSIVYCTKYCLKHGTTPLGRKPTFRLVSKMNGGLGLNYLEKMREFHVSNQQTKFVSYNGKTSRMPRYYRTKLGIVQDKFGVFEQNYQNALYDFRCRYSEFARQHADVSQQRLQCMFNESERARKQRANDLVLKHCKDQKL